MNNAAGSKRNVPLDELIEESGLLPLWTHFHKVASREPQPIDRPHSWPWKDILPLIERSAQEVSMEHAERRALVLANPSFDGKLITTGGLNAAFQILAPGESAEPHRHTAAAIRFIVESEGAATTVNGRYCEMRPGDLILTPAWTWHGHVNDTDHRAVWLDGLDVPLVRFDMDSFFFEPGRDVAPSNISADRSQEDAWAESGLIDAGSIERTVYSPKFRYPWAATERALVALPERRDGSKRMQYVNPISGNAVMPTIDCYVLQLKKGIETIPARTTYNSICLVVDGEGYSTIGDKRITWRKNDVFTVPHWHWATHRPVSDGANIFMMTDRELYKRLDLLREEELSSAISQ